MSFPCLRVIETSTRSDKQCTHNRVRIGAPNTSNSIKATPADTLLRLPPFLKFVKRIRPAADESALERVYVERTNSSDVALEKIASVCRDVPRRTHGRSSQCSSPIARTAFYLARQGADDARRHRAS